MKDWLAAASARHPDRPAVAADGRRLTYAELDAAAARAARRLVARGVGPHARVGAALPPGLAFVELLYALPRVKAALVPLDPSRPRAAVDLDATLTAPLEAGPEARAGGAPELEPQATHSVVHSSGTTGEPNPVELTVANVDASARATAQALGTNEHDRWLCALPVHHVAGLMIPVRAAASGACVVLHERFDPGRVRAELAGGGITHASFVPTMLRRLLTEGPLRAPSLRVLLLGGGPIPLDLLELDLPIVPTYGMTETTSQVALGSPGRPLPGVELRVAAPDGEILVRGPMVAPAELAPDGWLHTGDAGRLDSDGLLHVVGRLKELIVSGGENVAPAEVEAVLLEHPAVRDAGVVGEPDREWGEAVVAYVVLAAAATEGQLREHCRHRLAPFKVPKRIEPVDHLPRTAAGKLARDRLAGGGRVPRR